MQLNISNNEFLFSRLAVSVIVVSVCVSCVETDLYNPAQLGSVAQAADIRKPFNDGLLQTRKMQEKVNQVFMQIRQIQALHPLVIDLGFLYSKPQHKPIVLPTMIAAMHGTYTETTVGTFQVESGGDSIQIFLLNGMDIFLRNIVFSGWLGLNYQMEVKSSQRSVTTPPLHRIDLEVKITRIDSPLLSVSPVAGIFQLLEGTALDESGSGEIYDYYIRHNRSSILNSADLRAVFSDNSEFKLVDLSNPNIDPINRTINEGYSSNSYVKNLFLSYEDSSLSAGLLVVYPVVIENNLLKLQPPESSESIPALANTFGYISSSQNVLATISGNYTCDVNNPTAAGSGLPIELKWLDNYTERLMPGAEQTCERLLTLFD